MSFTKISVNLSDEVLRERLRDMAQRDSVTMTEALPAVDLNTEVP